MLGPLRLILSGRSKLQICDERVVYEYYQTQLTYQGGTQAVRDLFYERVTKVANISPSNGWITLRFLVNCEDRVGRIRSFGIDQEYNVATIDTELKQQLHTIAKSLEDWSRKAPFDSYYMVRFKIVNGKIQEIFKILLFTLVALIFLVASLILGYWITRSDKEKADLLYTLATPLQGQRVSQVLFSKAISYDPANSKIYMEQSVPFNKRGDFTTGFRLLDRAVALDTLAHLGIADGCTSANSEITEKRWKISSCWTV